MSAFYVRDGEGFREAQGEEILARARSLMANRFRKGAPVLSEPHRVHRFLSLRLGSLDHEVFGVLHVDARYRLIAVEDMFRGTVDAASVYCREIVKSVIQHNTVAVILYHNHPSGIADPSKVDRKMTYQVKQALDLINVSVLDHLVIGESVYSFAEHGIL